ncbi:MAG: conserved membrane protein of unknown function [Promethearchaeota archaeon]|nr:MAG: conserved membrane protein of unknown function [Candidatus Lokiarchaeota archaeon]
MAVKAYKGILWAFVFLISGVIFGVIPTYLIVRYWVWLNQITIDGQIVYTFALFALFLWFVTLLLTLIYLAAMVRSVLQRKNEEGLGIPKGVKYFGLATDLIIIAFVVIWYLLFDEIAFFSMSPP